MDAAICASTIAGAGAKHLIMPPQAQSTEQPMVTAGPGIHEVIGLGTQGAGLKPPAAAVPAATIGLAMLVQVPNGLMFNIGTLSDTFATVGLPASKLLISGMRPSGAGAVPMWQDNKAPSVRATSGIPCSPLTKNSENDVDYKPTSGK